MLTYRREVKPNRLCAVCNIYHFLRRDFGRGSVEPRYAHTLAFEFGCAGGGNHPGGSIFA